MMPDLANSCKPGLSPIRTLEELGARVLLLTRLFLRLFVSYHDAENQDYARERSHEKKDRGQSRIGKDAEGSIDPHHQGRAYDQSRQHQAERNAVRNFLKTVEYYFLINRVHADLQLVIAHRVSHLVHAIR